MEAMELRERFEQWLERAVGSAAIPALRRYLAGHGYKPFACVEHAGACQYEIYHPQLGFYRATGGSEHEALLGILRQIWLVQALQTSSKPEVGPAADRR